MTTIYKFPITAHCEIFPVDSEEAKLNFGSSEKEKKMSHWGHRNISLYLIFGRVELLLTGLQWQRL